MLCASRVSSPAPHPRYKQDQLKQGDRELYNAYLQSMKLAKEQEMETVAFSLLSAGIFRGPRSLEFVIEVGKAKFRPPFAATPPDIHYPSHISTSQSPLTHPPIPPQTHTP